MQTNPIVIQNAPAVLRSIEEHISEEFDAIMTLFSDFSGQDTSHVREDCIAWISQFLFRGQTDFIFKDRNDGQLPVAMFYASEDTENLIGLSIQIICHTFLNPEFESFMTYGQLQGHLQDILKDDRIFFADLDYELREFMLEIKEAWIKKSSQYVYDSYGI